MSRRLWDWYTMRVLIPLSAILLAADDLREEIRPAQDTSQRAARALL